MSSCKVDHAELSGGADTTCISVSHALSTHSVGNRCWRLHIDWWRQQPPAHWTAARRASPAPPPDLPWCLPPVPVLLFPCRPSRYCLFPAAHYGIACSLPPVPALPVPCRLSRYCLFPATRPGIPVPCRPGNLCNFLNAKD